MLTIQAEEPYVSFIATESTEGHGKNAEESLIKLLFRAERSGDPESIAWKSMC